jgi:aminopeptidase N
VASAFHQPEQAALLAPYAQRYFDVLPGMWSASGGHLRVARGAALFPVTAASQELIDQIDAFLGSGERELGLVRVLIERRDQVRLALRSRSLTATAL